MNGSASHSLKDVLEKFSSLTLAEVESVKLMNRKDTKYVIPESLLPELLEKLVPQYQLLTVENHLVQSYESIYFDTKEFAAYRDHHNGKLNRTKLRIRNYVESAVSFFEMKMKDNRKRTVKKRVSVPFRSQGITVDESTLLGMKWRHGIENTKPVLGVNFHRIMLASLQRGERVSIDVDLHFIDLTSGREVGMDGLAVIEVKRNISGDPSPMRDELMELRIMPSSFSKFCIGVARLFPDVKRNSFKRLLLRLEKSSKQATAIRST